jgi:CelD/BcsL family acetyltransferase involved in cellulose biosynthesis
MFHLIDAQPATSLAAPAGWSTVVVRDGAGLEPYIPAWEALAASALEPNLFYEPWMFLPAQQALGGQTAFRFVLVFAPHPSEPQAPPVLSGFFPLEFERTYRRFPVSIVRLWVHPYGPLGTPLVRAATAGACLETFLRWLASDRQSAALMEFNTISADGPFYRELITHLQRRGSFVQVRAESQRALFRRGDSGDTYLQAALSGDQRKSLRRKTKRLEEQGKIEYALLGPDGDLDRWLQDFFRLEASGWKGRAGTAMAQNPQERAFFETAVAAAFRLGRLRFFALTLNGQALAYQIYFPAGAGAYAHKTAYDEASGRFSPGMLIQVELIRRMHEYPEFEWMDSCSEPDGFLNSLWKERRSLQTLVVATGSLRGRLALAALPRLERLKRLFSRPAAPASSASPAADE